MPSANSLASRRQQARIAPYPGRTPRGNGRHCAGAVAAIPLARLRSTVLFLVALLIPSAASARCPGGVDTAAFIAPGSHGVGVRTLPLLDTSRPTPENPDVNVESHRPGH
jgi:hypothetical protein